MKSKETEDFLNHCILFDPSKDGLTDIPNVSGNYIIVLRKNCKLPKTKIDPVYHEYKGLEVIYTGVSEQLRTRDAKNHFNGNAGSSTLRKSLGSLMGLTKIPRSASKPEDGKTKFTPEDEQHLSMWMKKNLVLYYCPNTEYEVMENALIAEFNPPLNLLKNHNPENKEFRDMVSEFRSKR